MPLGATIAKAKVMDWVPGAHASTFGGNPLSCVAALAVINVIKEEKLLDNATKQGAHIMKRLGELKENCDIVGDVRGRGLMIGMEVVEDRESKKPAPKKAADIMMRSWKRGINIITCGASTIRIAPPIIITQELVNSALDIIEDVTKEVAKEA
jgi:4-aminobutyrate aminotransferase